MKFSFRAGVIFVLSLLCWGALVQQIDAQSEASFEPNVPQANINEGFEGGTFPPAGWATFRGTNGLGTAYDWQSSVITNTGSGAAFVRYENVTGGTAEDWLVTPQLRPEAGNNQLSFYMRQAFTADWGSVYTIRVSTNSQTTHADFSTVQTYAEADFTITYQQFTVDLSGYNGQDIYVAFVMENDDGDSWHIDDVSGVALPPVTTPPNCAVADSPTDGAVDILNSATLNWSSGGGAPTGYVLNFGTDGGGVSTPTNIVNGSDLGNVTTYDPAGLNTTTTYYWQVVPYNGNGSATGCPIWSFTTGADATMSTFPYSENFDGGIPLYWTIENSNGDSYEWTTDTTYRRGTSGGSLKVRWNSGVAMDDWLFTRPLSLTAGTTYGVRFFYQARSSTFPESLEILWGSSADSAGMTNGPIFSDIDFTHTEMLEGIATFTPSADGTYHVGFHGLSSANQYELFLDDVTIYESPNVWAWQGTADNDWTNGANWEGDIAPGELDDVVIPSGTPNDPYVDAYFSEPSYGPVNNLTIDDGATLELDTNTSLSVAGTLTNNGTFSQTKNVPLGGPVTFLDYGVYGGVVITPTSINMGNVTVAIQGNQPGCTINAADALITRCFEITPATAGDADILFHYTEGERNSQDAANLQLWHYDGPPGQWSSAGTVTGNSEAGTTCTSGNCWVLVGGVSNYSPFTLGSGATPTAVTMQSTTADSASAPWLPVAVTGLLLLLTGTAVRLLRRREW